MEDLAKKIVIALDGSKDSLKALDYIELIFGVDHPLDVVLFHVLPALPPIPLDDNDPQDRKMRAKLRAREKEHREAAERILEQGKRVLIEKGFSEKRIATEYQKKAKSVARDTCDWSERRLADAAVIARGERVALGDFFSAGVSSNLVDHCRVAPVWIVSGQIRSSKALLCVDDSEESVRAVDHAGFMLSHTDFKITLFHAMKGLKRAVSLEVVTEEADFQRLWGTKAGKEIAPVFQKAEEMLAGTGIAPSHIGKKIVEGRRSAAEDILTEAKDGDYGTIILGRRNRSKVQSFLFGSVTKKILQNDAGLCSWIIQ
jgi:nucleotide-binding universal stress UspA family protein